MNNPNKIEILQKLEKLIAIKIEGFEKDIQKLAPTMNENNLAFFLKGQEQLIQKWRQFAIYLKKHKNQHSSRVEDGALIKISGYSFAEWIYIYKLSTSMEIDGITVTIDDGCLEHTQGSLFGSRVGDVINLQGDGRGIPDLTIRILAVL
jgi:hypothetical protein